MFITNVKIVGGTVNKQVVYGILMGLVKAYLSRCGGDLDSIVKMAGCHLCTKEYIYLTIWLRLSGLL